MGHALIVTTKRYIHATDHGKRGATNVLSAGSSACRRLLKLVSRGPSTYPLIKSHLVHISSGASKTTSGELFGVGRGSFDPMVGRRRKSIVIGIGRAFRSRTISHSLTSFTSRCCSVYVFSCFFCHKHATSLCSDERCRSCKLFEY